MMGRRKRYSAELKATVAFGAIRGAETLAQLAAKQRVHRTLINACKTSAIEGLSGVLSGNFEAARAARGGEIEPLHAKIGQLVVEWDFCSGPPVDGHRTEVGDDGI